MRKLIYILSCANSGSTLLTRVLAKHREIATVGELKATPKSIGDVEAYRCSCGTLLQECSFWKEVQTASRKEGFDLDLRDFQTDFVGEGGLANKLIRTPVRNAAFERMRDVLLKLWPGAAKQIERIMRHNRIVIDAVCKVQSKPVFLDGSKDPIRLKHFHDSGEFDLRVIHLVRDGRAVLASYKKRNPHIGENLRLWKAKAEECEELRRILPPAKFMTLRYEDFCRDVSETLESLEAFIGLELDPDLLADADRKQQHIVGHNSRMKAIGTIEERTEWHELLDPSELQKFRKVGKEINTLYRYG